MSDPMLDSVLGVVDTEEHVLPQPKAPKTEKVETKTTETKEVEAPKTEPKTETKTENKKVETDPSDDEEVEDTQDFSRTSDDESEPEEKKQESTAPSKTETEKPEKEAESTDEWEPTLPAPPKFNLAEPIVNEEGYITNYDQPGYERYITEKAKYEMRLELHADRVENEALDAAEKILPEIKTNKAIRQLVQNTREASILTGKQINSYEAAKTVKEALGLTSTKLAEAKAAGANNAKVSITTQKNAAVETQGSTKKKVEVPFKSAQLSKRLKAGDDSAFAELFDSWDKEGKLS